MGTAGRLQDVNAGVVARVLPVLGLGPITIDVDGIGVSVGLQVEGAFRGLNPHHRKVPGYYPILAHLGETSDILRKKIGQATCTTGRRACRLLCELRAQLVAMLERRRGVRLRMDDALFREDALRWLLGRFAAYAIKVSFDTWLVCRRKFGASPRGRG